MNINFSGIIIGLISFAIIGLFHPIVIKTEYYFGKKAWPAFMIMGMISLLASLIIADYIASTCLGVLSFTLFWSIKELFEQEKRVKKGWFPENPSKK